MQGFLAHRDRPARLVRAAETVAGEHALELLVERMMKNHLADRSRQTEVGKLHRRLRHVLARDGRFVCVHGDAWALRARPTAETWGGRQDDLALAAWEAVRSSPMRERRRVARAPLPAGRLRARFRAHLEGEDDETRRQETAHLLDLHAIWSKTQQSRTPEVVLPLGTDVGTRTVLAGGRYRSFFHLPGVVLLGGE